MTTLAWDMCEQLPYTATLAQSTRIERTTAFRAGPPVASPAEALKMGRDAQLIDALIEALGEDEYAPSLSALGNFQALLRLLPAEMPATEAYITPSGSICLDWDEDPRYQLSILLKDKNQIAFAAYFLGEKVHGSTRFTSHQLPSIMASVAKRWLKTQRI